jgi:hypothetical protein
MGAHYQIRLFNEAEDIDQTVEVEGDPTFWKRRKKQDRFAVLLPIRGVFYASRTIPAKPRSGIFVW